MKKSKLTVPQYNIWLTEQYYGKNSINTIHAIVEFDEPVDAGVLRDAVTCAARACDVFGLRFETGRNGEPVQFIDESITAECRIDRDIHTEREISDMIERRSRTQFDLSSGGLYDFCIYQSEDATVTLSILTHHIIIDIVGLDRFIKNALDVYLQSKNGQHPAPRASDFLGCAERAGEYLDFDEDKRFWANYFPETVTPPILSSSKPSTPELFHLCKEIPPELSAMITGFCEQHSVTPYTLFAAALTIYICRATQSEETVIILPRANRGTQQERETAGMFTLAVPILTRLGEKTTFPELCAEILKNGRTVSSHKKYGLSNILSDLKTSSKIESSLSGITLNYQNVVNPDSFDAVVTYVTSGEMHNDITINVRKSDDGFSLEYDVRAELFSRERIGFIHDSLEMIIRNGMTSTDYTRDMDIIAPAEMDFLENGLSGKTVPYGSDETILSVFNEAVRLYGDKTAVIANGVSLTYRELDLLSNRFARVLRKKGLREGQIAAFMLHRDENVVPVLFGILKAGGAFLPIDPQYPDSRTEYILSDSRAAFLISDTPRASYGGLVWISPEELKGDIDDSPVETYVTQDALAYVIYTSGTTGRPKGTQLIHRGIVNIVKPDNNPFNRDICAHGRGIVAVGSLCFDISYFEIFVPLFNGIKVILADEESCVDPGKIAGLIESHGANILHITPSRLAHFLKEKTLDSAGVEIILSAGEVLSGALIDALKRKNMRIYNGYGPTETTIGTSITGANDDVSIGRPIANTAVMILDGRHRMLPFGCQGELAISGDGLGRGYLDREITAQKFITVEDRPVYLTGDIGAYLEDGRLVYRGRNDTQIKLRGLRIEISEIENCMLMFPEVSFAAVIVRQISGNEHLVGFYTADENTSPEELKNHLRDFLVPYMVPGILVPLPQIPLNSNGKTDRKKLMEIPVEIKHAHTEDISEDERLMCLIFGEVLETDEVDVNDNFFEIGGTSLLAAKVMMAARRHDLVINYSDIFNYSTPRLLLEACKNQQRDNPGDRIKALDYSMANSLLAGNLICKSIPKNRLGNVLLTGATGFLGIHILKELMEKEDSADRVFCLVRSKEPGAAEKRLLASLFYYFENAFLEDFGTRLFIIEGDITDKESLMSIDADIDTVINAAANVAHFAYGDAIDRVNTDGAMNLLDFCKERKAALVHISTLSVSGYANEEQIKRGMILDEASLYVGQTIHNQYILSKYIAEYRLLSKSDGCPVKIMRVGNLQGRLSDGEFQMNLKANAFTRQLTSYVHLKKAPKSLADMKVNFSPVDETAKAITLLSETGAQFTVFHAYNPVSVDFGMIFDALNAIGHPIELVDDNDFYDLVERVSKTREGRKSAEGILLEKSDVHLREVPCESDFSVSALKELGFSWGNVSPEFLKVYFGAIDALGMFYIADS